MGHANTPPQLPEVSDEAANTPRWVPLLGIVLFVASVGAIIWSHAGDSSSSAEAPAEAAP